MSLHDHPTMRAIRQTWPGATTNIIGGHALIDANEHEMAAMANAAERGGEFIESTGQTDMAQWSAEQWHQFIEVICGGYVDGLMAQEAAIARSVAKVRAA